MDNREKKMIEALLFCSNQPLTAAKIVQILHDFHPLSKNEVIENITLLAKEYEQQDRSFRLLEIANGYILKTCEEFHPMISTLLGQKPDKLSNTALEVLAIIAFRQPITRSEIDEIRGVDSAHHLSGLLERELIETAGKLEVPGRPILYRVTGRFLNHFGLKSIEEFKRCCHEIH